MYVYTYTYTHTYIIYTCIHIYIHLCIRGVLLREVRTIRYVLTLGPHKPNLPPPPPV